MALMANTSEAEQTSTTCKVDTRLMMAEIPSWMPTTGPEREVSQLEQLASWVLYIHHRMTKRGFLHELGRPEWAWPFYRRGTTVRALEAKRVACWELATFVFRSLGIRGQDIKEMTEVLMELDTLPLDGETAGRWREIADELREAWYTANHTEETDIEEDGDV